MHLFRTSLIVAGLTTLCLSLPFSAMSASAANILLAQGPMPGQSGGMQPQGRQNMPQGQPGMAGQPAGGNNSCLQSYQRCVMMCAGVANCLNNCNVGYTVCTRPQNGRK